MEEAILDKLIEMDERFDKIDARLDGMDKKFDAMDKKIDDNKNEVIEIINRNNESILNVLANFEKFMNEKIEKQIREIKELRVGINETKHEIGKINDKIDILYSSDLLNKKILDNHEHRITKAEMMVADIGDDSYNNS